MPLGVLGDEMHEMAVLITDHALLHNWVVCFHGKPRLPIKILKPQALLSDIYEGNSTRIIILDEWSFRRKVAVAALHVRRQYPSARIFVVGNRKLCIKEINSLRLVGATPLTSLEFQQYIHTYVLSDQLTGERGNDICTPRERSILDLLAQGYSNKMIAAKIRISEGTVRFHINNLFSKFQVRSRVLLATIAISDQRTQQSDQSKQRNGVSSNGEEIEQ